MNNNQEILRIFVASPLDMGRERAHVLRAVESINRLSSDALDIRLETLVWENMPGLMLSHSEQSIQSVINKEIERCQIFILILGARYGLIPPGETKSFTESEFEHVLAHAKKSRNVLVLTYFKDVGFQSDPGPQLLKVLSFKKKIEEEGFLYRTFKETDDFITSLTHDLYGILLRHVAERKTGLKEKGNAAYKKSKQKKDNVEAPRVFVSYSHDNKMHVRWVLKLATNCIENGVNILLDLWDLHPGDDVAEFMERSIAESKRVLVICTPNYVCKANDGTGGVGYEKTIITGEIVRNIGTKKFIPLLRESSEETDTLPRSLSSRLYIDFRDEQKFDESLDVLLREIHGFPEYEKPEIGGNPYA